MARSRGLGWPRGARDSRSITGYAETGIAVKIQNETMTVSLLNTWYKDYHRDRVCDWVSGNGVANPPTL